MTNLFSEYRKRAGLTQNQVGDYIGISPQAVSKWENGQTQPDIDTLCKLASLYNITVDELVGRSNKPKYEGEGAPDASKKPSFIERMKKERNKKILIIAASIILAVSIIFTVIGCSLQDRPEAMLEKYEKIVLGMTMVEVQEILGMPEESIAQYFEEDDYISAALARMQYGYYNADFWYYRGSEYDDNLKADMDFDMDYEFKPYYQVRVTFDSEGKVIETYFNSQTNYFSIIDDYGGGDKTATSVEFLEKSYTNNKKEKVKIYFDDGSIYLGEVEIVTDSGEKVIEHPWGDIIVE